MLVCDVSVVLVFAFGVDACSCVCDVSAVFVCGVSAVLVFGVSACACV